MPSEEESTNKPFFRIFWRVVDRYYDSEERKFVEVIGVDIYADDDDDDDDNL
jgi:hypothetical protein